MVESWIDLEKRITGTDTKTLKDNLLNDVNYILDSFGTVSQYYNRTNPHAAKINKKIIEFRNIRDVATGQKDEDLMKKLYMECSKAEVIVDKDYQEFYVAFCRGTSLPCYGDSIGENPGHFGVYTVVLNSIWIFKKLLEKGKTSDSTEKFDEYRKNITEANSIPKNSDHYA